MKRLRFVAGIAFLLTTSAHQAKAVSFTFNDNTEQIMTTVVGAFASLPAEPFDITNNTGTTWVDFHMTLVGRNEFGLDYPFMRFIDLGTPGIYSGPGNAVFSDVNGDALGYNEVMTLSALSISDGSALMFTVDIFGGVAPEGLAEFDIVGMPSLQPSMVPEPSTVLFVGCGFVALWVRRRSQGMNS